MSIRLVRARDLARTPWKNGGGTTAEIAAHPQGAGFSDFGWRLSMADVAADGPFSAFPGIDRTLVLIEGHGLELEVDGVSHRLETPGTMLSFPGEAGTVGRLSAGPVRGLNVMTRRGRFTHRVDCVAMGKRDGTPGSGEVLALLALHDRTRVTSHGRAHSLDRFDAMLIAGPGSLSTDHAVLQIVLLPVRP